MSPEGYERWRKSIPFTDEEIAQALESEGKLADEHTKHTYFGDWYRRGAELARRGHITSQMLRHVLPILVKICCVREDGKMCGKKALYRVGTEGRCSGHRHISTTFAIERLQRKETMASQIEADHRERDYIDLSRQSYKNAKEKHR